MFYKIPLTRRGNSAEDFCLPECWQQNSQMITSRADSMLTVSSIGKWSRFLGSCEANLVKTALCPKGGTLPLIRIQLEKTDLETCQTRKSEPRSPKVNDLTWPSGDLDTHPNAWGQHHITCLNAWNHEKTANALLMRADIRWIAVPAKHGLEK